VARITRKELKTDKFALEVEHTVTFFEEHRALALRYGGIAVLVALLIVGLVIYRGRQRTARQQELAAAIQVQEAPVGSGPAGAVSFPTQAEKDKAAIKAFADLATKYRGTEEGIIAENYLGSIAADEGKLTDAESRFKSVADSGNDMLASVAKLSLAQIYQVQGRNKEAETLLRNLMDHPTDLVSREQAAFTLARLLAKTNLAEARKLVDPLRTSSNPTVSQQAITLSAELAQQ
jgi:predicted negative regulator of RcsB-dependent stress response